MQPREREHEAEAKEELVVTAVDAFQASVQQLATTALRMDVSSVQRRSSSEKTWMSCASSRGAERERDGMLGRAQPKDEAPHRSVGIDAAAPVTPPCEEHWIP